MNAQGKEHEAEVEALKAERDYWRGIAQTVAPEYPVVAIPVETLNTITERAEKAEAALDAVTEREHDPGDVEVDPARMDAYLKGLAAGRSESSPEREALPPTCSCGCHAPSLERDEYVEVECGCGCLGYQHPPYRVAPSPERDTEKLVDLLTEATRQDFGKPGWRERVRKALAEFSDASKGQ